MAVAISTASAEDHSVAAVQHALRERQFYFGDIDGNLDFATQAALRRFQFRNGLTGTAGIDAATLQALDLQAPPKAVAVATSPVAQAVKVESGLAQQAQLDEQRLIAGASTQAPSSHPQKRSVPPGAISVPSWHDAHKVDSDVDEMRFAQRAAPVSNFQLTPAAIRAITSPSTPQDESPAEQADAGVKAPVHFTGMDGHIYTYYKKVTAATQQSQAALATNEASAFPSAPQRMAWTRNARGEWQRVDGQ